MRRTEREQQSRDIRRRAPGRRRRAVPREPPARAHKAYGQALGVTQAKGAPPPVPQVRETRDAVLDDVRVYAAQIVASVTRKDPASEELAEMLLRPISAWPTKRGGTAVTADGDPAPLLSAPAE